MQLVGVHCELLLDGVGMRDGAVGDCVLGGDVGGEREGMRGGMEGGGEMRLWKW